MADLGFLPGVRRIMDTTPARRSADAVLRHPRRRRGRARQALPLPPGHAPGRLGAEPRLHDDPPRAARQPRRAGAGAREPHRRPGTQRGLHPDQARRQEAGEAPQRLRRVGGRAARQPQPERPDPQHGPLPPWRRYDAGGDRYRRSRHPRRRRRDRHPRRPSGRAQGLPAPLRPYRPRRCRRRGRHPDDRRPGQRRPRPDPAGRSAPHDHAGRLGASPPGRARSGAARPDQAGDRQPGARQPARAASAPVAVRHGPPSARPLAGPPPGRRVAPDAATAATAAPPRAARRAGHAGPAVPVGAPAPLTRGPRPAPAERRRSPPAPGSAPASADPRRVSGRRVSGR